MTLVDRGQATRPPFRGLIILASLPLLAACGGGSHVVSTPPPPLSAPPPPVPLGLTIQSDYSVLAIVQRGASDPERTEAVEFRYSSADQAYEIRLPEMASRRLSGSQASQGLPFASVAFETTDASGSPRSVGLNLYTPGAANPQLALTYTSMANWAISGAGSSSQNGAFAYGVPAAPNDVPVTGTGTYFARLSGGSTVGGRVTGDARLVFDFGQGALSGYMLPILEDPTGLGFNSAALGTYTFTETVFARGSPNFSGRFIAPGTQGDSRFDGTLTGPNGVELMARWHAPFVHPDQLSGTIFGVWVGRRQ